MKELWKKYKEWISLGIFFVLFFLALLFIIRTMVANISNNSDEIQRKIIDNEINRSRIAKIPEMKKGYESFAEKEDELNVVLDVSNEVDFIKSLESLAEETGNKINLKIEEDKKTDKATAKKEEDKENIKNNLPYEKYISISIGLEGKYDGLMNFIHKLENMKYFVNIVSLDFAKAEEEKNNDRSRPNIFLPASGSSGNANIEQEITPSMILKSSLNIVVYLKK